MLITQKPDYARKIEEDRLSPFSNDEVLLNLADKKLSNVDTYTALTYFNYAVVLNSHIERALACESPRMQPAVQRLCELSSLVGKAADIRVSGDEQASLSAFTKALLARRAADLILTHQATSSFNTNTTPEWKVCVSALSRLALYWLAACKHTTPATSALVALEALEANCIRKYLNVDENLVEKLLQHAECPERLADACGAVCPSATSSPSRSGHTFTPTLISFVPLGGFESCIEGAAEAEAPTPLTGEKYTKCIGALSATLEHPMVLRRLLNVMRTDPDVSSGSFIDSLFPSLTPYPTAALFKGLFNAELTRFDLKCYLLFLIGWIRVCLSSPLSSVSGASRLLSPAPLPSSLITQHQSSLWNGLVLRAQKRFVGLAEHALPVQAAKKVTRLITAPPVPLMGTVFYTIRDEAAGSFVAELYARKIVETICCSDASADRTVFRAPQGGIDFDTEDETRLLHDSSMFICGCEMAMGDWIAAERTLLMCDGQEKSIVTQLVELYTAWSCTLAAGGDMMGREEVERKLREAKAKMHKESPRSDKENEYCSNGRKESSGSMRGMPEMGKTRSPAISIEGDDLNKSSISEYASAPSTPFKNGTIFGAETPNFFTPGGRPSLWPGALAGRNLFQNATSTPKTSRAPPPVLECKEEEVQTDADDSLFIESSVSVSAPDETHVSMSSSSRRRLVSDGIKEEEFELESIMKNLDIINDEFVKQAQAKVDQLTRAREEELNDEKKRKEREEEERRRADEEIRTANEEREKKRNAAAAAAAAVATTAPPRTPHRPLGPTQSVANTPGLSSSPSLALDSSLLPRLAPDQRVLLQSYMQQQPLLAAATTPLGPGSSMLQQLLLSAVSGPASVQSPGIHRMGQLGQGGLLPRPLFPTTVQQPQVQPMQQLQQAAPVVNEQMKPLAPSRTLSAFEAAFQKKKEEEKGEKKEGETKLHPNCLCCADDDKMDRFFKVYDEMATRNDRVD